MHMLLAFTYPDPDICCEMPAAWEPCSNVAFVSSGEDLRSIKCHTLIPVLSVLLSVPSIIPKGYESLFLSNSQKGIWTENTVVVYLLWIKHVIKVYESTCASFERARFAVFLSIRKQDRIYKWFGESGTSNEYLKNSFAHLHEVLNRLPPADTAAVISKNC